MSKRSGSETPLERLRKRLRSDRLPEPRDDDMSDFVVEDGADVPDGPWEQGHEVDRLLNNDSEVHVDPSELLNGDPEVYVNYRRVMAAISASEPDIRAILRDDMLLEDRVELFQLFELYKSMEPSEEQLALKKRIGTKHKQAVSRYAQQKLAGGSKHVEEQLQNLSGGHEQEELRCAIVALNTTIENKRVIYEAYKRLQTLREGDEERAKLRHWIGWALSLPYDHVKPSQAKAKSAAFLQKVAKRLDEELYGMQVVKEQILLYLRGRIQNPGMKRSALGLVGPPGTGKTRIARLLADLVELPFEQIAFGGVSDPGFLKGHLATYIGAEPGEIVRRLTRMKCKNGIVFLDEFNRISDSPELCASLLHVTDPVQNSEFRDNFLSGITIDLSHLWFIFSMNELPRDSALRDRIFAINVPGYDRRDKVRILCDHLLPKALQNADLSPTNVVCPERVAGYLVDRLSSRADQGVRSLEQGVDDMVAKIAFLRTARGIDVSFAPERRIRFPLTLTPELVDRFTMCAQ